MTVLGLVFNLRYNKSMNYLKEKFSKATLVFLFVISFIPTLLLADEPPDAGKIQNPISAETLNGLIKTVLEGVIKIGIPIIALALVYCGFLFVAARGNSEKISKAKDALLYTLIGAALLLGSWAIAMLISNTVLAL